MINKWYWYFHNSQTLLASYKSWCTTFFNQSIISQCVPIFWLLLIFCFYFQGSCKWVCKNESPATFGCNWKSCKYRQTNYLKNYVLIILGVPQKIPEEKGLYKQNSVNYSQNNNIILELELKKKQQQQHFICFFFCFFCLHSNIGIRTFFIWMSK